MRTTARNDGLWEIRLLGALEATRGDSRIARFSTQPTANLLAYLAYNLSQSHPRESLADRIWPGKPPKEQRHSLCQALHSLKRQFGSPSMPWESILVGSNSEIRLNPRAVRTDVSQFAWLDTRARQTADSAERLALSLRAVNLYTGDLVPSCFDDWAVVARERLAAAFARLLRESLKQLEERGEREHALELALHAFRAAPHREPACKDAIRLLAATGQPAQARELFELLTQSMRDYSNHNPSPALEEFVNRECGLGARPSRRPAPVAVSECSKPEPSNANQSPKAAQSWPLDLTRFIGREEELTSLRALLEPSSSSRLITLVGPGGVGKTRLAVEAALSLDEAYGGRLHFVSLGSLTDGDSIKASLLSAAGLSSDSKDVVGALSETWDGPAVLLVLDNAEHVADFCAGLIDRLLESIAGLHCLVTSRTTLKSRGEQVVRVSPLPVPAVHGTPERLSEFASIQMFVDRARLVSPDFVITPRNAPTMATLCQRLEGLPLAIELAAARSYTLTPAQMLTEMEDRFGFLVSRQRGTEARRLTLRDTIQWSYSLLSPEAQKSLRFLSVFTGGCTLAAARAVIGKEFALAALEELLDHSLLQSRDQGDEKRYSMLELIREFAAERLSEPERKFAESLHARYYASLAEEMNDKLVGSEGRSAIRTLDTEHPNLRAALSRGADPNFQLRIAAALWRYWSQRGSATEGRTLLSMALDSGEGPRRLRIRALNGYAALAHQQQDFAAGSLRLEESIRLATECDDLRGLAEALHTRAVALDEQGFHEQAEEDGSASLQIRQSLGDYWGAAASHNALGRIARNRGRLDAARLHLRHSLKIYETLEDWSRAAILYNNLGVISYEARDFPAASAAYEHILDLARDSGDRLLEATALYNLAEARFRMGARGAVAHPLIESIRILLEVGDRGGVGYPLITLANLAAEGGDFVRAARLMAAAEHTLAASGMELPVVGRELQSRDIELIRSSLPDWEFQAAWEYGSTLPLERTIAIALQDYHDEAFESDRASETGIPVEGSEII